MASASTETARGEGSASNTVDMWDKRLTYSVDSSTECWVFTGNRTQGRYATLVTGSRSDGSRETNTKAHRYAYELYTELPIPEGLCVCHACDNPRCINPKHLFLGTHAENMADMKGKKRYRLPDQRGDKNPMSKLTWEKVRKIRERYVQGVSLKTLGEDNGVHLRTISDVVNNVTWRE